VNLLDKILPGKPSQRAFADTMMRAFEAAGVRNLEYREAEFALKIPGKDTTVFLSNLYAAYCNAPRKERQSVVAKLVASFTSIPEIPGDFATAKLGLMPVIRDAAYYGITELISRKNGTRDPDMEAQAKPLVSGLLVGLAYDSEHNITAVSKKQIEQWGVGLDEAFAAAKDNLWEKTDPNRLEGKGGVYWGQWGDSYDSSLMLLTELMYRLSVDGDPVAFVPNRDVLLVTGKDNVAGLNAILKTGAESHFNQGHPVSPDLYVLVDGVWKVYVPEDAALREMWLSLRRNRDALDYSQQKKILDESHEQQGIDTFVASFNIYEGKDGSVYSLCVWSNGVDSTLPRAERIGFVVSVEDNDMFVVPWDAAMPVAGSLLEEEAGLVPVRYRARQFPSEEQIAQLRALAK
jgi:hypothetical protein